MGAGGESRPVIMLGELQLNNRRKNRFICVWTIRHALFRGDPAAALYQLDSSNWNLVRRMGSIRGRSGDL